MPIIDLVITDATTNIIDAVMYQTGNSVLQQLGLQDYFPDNIYYYNEYLNGSIAHDQNNNVNLSRDRCDITVNHSVNPNDVKWDVMSFQFTQAYGTFNQNRYDINPVFIDAAAGVQMFEHYMPCSITMEFSLKFKNKEHAYLAISAINNISNNSSVPRYHDLAYEYPFDMNMFNVLSTVFGMRNSINTQINFEQYMAVATKGAFSSLVNKTLQTKEVVIKKSSVKALGMLEFAQQKPEGMSEDKIPDRFVVNFTYYIQFGRPDSVRITFPPVIENQMVPSFMVKVLPTSGITDLIGQFQEGGMYAAMRTLSGKTAPFVKTPLYDDWAIPPSSVQLKHYYPFFCGGFTLDTTTTNNVTTVNPTTVINLQQLGEITLNPIAISIMQTLGKSMFWGQSIFQINVFVNDIQLDPRYLSIDDNLNVTITWADPIKRYHIVIYECVDYSILEPQWIQTIIQYRTFFPISIIKNLNFLIQNKVFFIDNSNYLLLTIQSSINDGNINAQIKALVLAGHVTDYLYLYANTEWQFASYLMEHRSPVSGRLLYDEYVTVLLNQGYITTNLLASGYIRTRKGYPILANTGGSVAFNTPIRFINAAINTTKSSNHG